MDKLGNDFIQFYIEEGILFSDFIKPTDLTLEIGKQIIELRHQISNNEKQYWCYNFDGVKSMPKEGRDYAAKHGQDFLYASAAVIDSQITKFIVNVFSMIKKPDVPFRAFVKKEDAVAWLKEMKEQNEKNK